MQMHDDGLCLFVDSPMHRRWRRDHSVAMDVPSQHRLRGCVGLAAMVAEGIQPLNVGDMMLLPNDAITWMAMRDLPPGCFPASCTMDGHTVRYVSSAVASLRFGVFTIALDAPDREAFDFGIEPCGPMYRVDDTGLVEEFDATGDILNSSQRRREFAAAIAITNWMTRAAGYGMDRDGRPVNSVWHEHRPDDGGCFQVPSPSAWMPRAYLAFPLHARPWLFHMATESPSDAWNHWCPGCRRWFAQGDLQAFEAWEDDHFSASCPRCRRRQRWDLESAVPAVCPRFLSSAFRNGFCRDLADGLPLASIEDCIYLGHAREQSAGPELVLHQFRTAIDGRCWNVLLPSDARVMVSVGTALKTGEVWCCVLERAPGVRWLRQDPRARWNSLEDICDSAAMVCLLEKLWFEHRMLRLPGHPDQILLPAELSGPACRHTEPAGLWWDVSRCQRHWNQECRSYVFPPIPLSHWSNLRMMLPGEVQLCTGIGDPRFVPPDGQEETLASADEGDAELSVPSTLKMPAESCAA